MATGYNVDSSAAPLLDFGWISPAGQMFSSARDLDLVSVAIIIHRINISHMWNIMYIFSVCKILYE